MKTLKVRPEHMLGELHHSDSCDEMSIEDLNGAHFMPGRCGECGERKLLGNISATIGFCDDVCERAFTRSLNA